MPVNYAPFVVLECMDDFAGTPHPPLRGTFPLRGRLGGDDVGVVYGRTRRCGLNRWAGVDPSLCSG